MAMYDNLLNSIKESSAANSALSQSMAREEMQFNAEQAALTRSWQEQMSNTAHQREVKDLLAAGLNPILSTGGAGASTPSGATATGKSGKVDESYSSALAGYLQSLISSATAIETAKVSAAASMYGSSVASSASRYSADRSYASSKYKVDNDPSGVYGIINSLTSGDSNTGGFLSSLYKGYQKYVGQPFARAVTSLGSPKKPKDTTRSYYGG